MEVADSRSMKESHAYLLNMIDDVKLLRRQQNYLEKRQRRHRKTLRSTQRKTILWTVVEAIGVVGASVLEVVVLRSFFNA